MKVVVIGAGIYGCHLALNLHESGHNVILFEKNNEYLSEASGKNQYRLHMGFHYARNYKTRKQSKHGFEIFMKNYGEHTLNVKDNLYFVPKENSLIDYGTYISIFENEKYKFDKLDLDDYSYLKDIEGGFRVDEKVININSLRYNFRKKLEKITIFKKKINNEDLLRLKSENDLVVDCTWNKLNPFFNSSYELTHLCYLKTKNLNHPAITLVDGPLWSIYPTYNKGIYTLSSVKNTPLVKSKSLRQIEDHRLSLSEEDLTNNYKKMVKEVEINYPKFLKNFVIHSHQISVKTKPFGISEPRDCRIFTSDNLISIFSGKIDTFYVAEEFINKNFL